MSENTYSFGVGSNDDSLKQNKNMMIGIKYMMEQRKTFVSLYDKEIERKN